MYFPEATGHQLAPSQAVRRWPFRLSACPEPRRAQTCNMLAWKTAWCEGERASDAAEYEHRSIKPVFCLSSGILFYILYSVSISVFFLWIKLCASTHAGGFTCVRLCGVCVVKWYKLHFSCLRQLLVMKEAMRRSFRQCQLCQQAFIQNRTAFYSL